MDTTELMRIGLELGRLDEVPADSGIWHAGQDIRRVLVGMDIGPAELLLARQLGFDAVVAHHPVIRRGFWRVFERHRELMREAGVPDDVIAEAIDARSAAMRLADNNTNDDHVPSVARLLNLPFLNIHLPLDEYTRQLLIRLVADHQRATPRLTTGQLAAAIGDLPSFRRSPVQPRVVHGSPEAPAGRVAVSIAAGTNGGFAVADAYLRHGSDTVIYMHIGADDLDHLHREATPGALIITGHSPADSIGIDAYVQELWRRGLEVVTFSGVNTA